MSNYVQAEVHAGAWKLPSDEVWNIPEENQSFVLKKASGSFGRITSAKALALTLDGKIFGLRTLSEVKEEGYHLAGRVSIGGKKYRAFTSSRLFEKEDGALIDVATLIVSNFEE